MQNRNQRLIFGLVGMIVMAIFGVLAYIGYLTLTTEDDEALDTYATANDTITIVESTDPIADFTLTNTANAPMSRDDFIGQATLMTFGFTHCPDVCPLTLNEMGTIQSGLSERGITTLDYVFVSIDGARDTPTVLATYFTTLRVDHFMTGLTGSDEALAPLTDEFGVEYILETPDAIGNYNVEHTAGMFLLDSEGQWVRRYRYGTPTGRIVDDIADFLANDA